jgi:hypothetical protein
VSRKTGVSRCAIVDCRSENAITLADLWVARCDFAQLVQRSLNIESGAKLRVASGMPSSGLT